MGRKRTEYNTDQHGKRESAKYFASENKQDDQNQHGTETGDHGTAKCTVQGIVNDRWHGLIFGVMQAEVFTHPVKDYNGIVDRIPHDGKCCCDELLVNIKREWKQSVKRSEERRGGKGCVSKCR